MKLKIVVFLLFLHSEHLRLSRVFPSALKQLVNSVAQPHMAFVSRIAGLCFDIKRRCGVFVVFA